MTEWLQCGIYFITYLFKKAVVNWLNIKPYALLFVKVSSFVFFEVIL